MRKQLTAYPYTSKYQIANRVYKMASSESLTWAWDHISTHIHPNVITGAWAFDGNRLLPQMYRMIEHPD